MARQTRRANDLPGYETENGLVLRRRTMDQAEWLESLYLQSMAARTARRALVDERRHTR